MNFLKTLFERYLDEELTPSQKDTVDNWKEGDNSFSDHAFGGEEKRSSVPLQHPSELSPYHGEIQKHFDQHGIKINDYVNNIATDKHGRTVKIGKALAKTGASPDLIKKFNEDSTRSRSRSGVDDYNVNISRHPHDVAGMTSGGQSWENESCMNFSSGLYRSYLPADVQHGTHVAYLSHKDDNTNKNPVGRIALKKYTNIEDENDHILRPENRTYGNAPDAFSHTVNKWVNHHFPGSDDGIYKKHDQVYDDTGNSIVMGKKAIPRAIQDSNSAELHVHAARHPDLTPEHIDMFLKADHIHPRQVADAIDNPNASKQNITDALSHKNIGVVSRALKSEHVNSEQLLKLAKSHSKPGGDPMILRQVMSHKNATPEIHNIGMKSTSWSVRHAVVEHPNASAKHITQGLNDEDEIVNVGAIANPNANAAHITQALLPHIPDHVREFAAGHENATPEHINMALNDGGDKPSSVSLRVRRYAASNPNASSENIHRALDHDQHISVRSRGLHNPNATGEHVMRALDDPDHDIRHDAINHKKVTAEHLDKAATDPSMHIRIAAISHRLATAEHVKKAIEGVKNESFLDAANARLKQLEDKKS